MNHSCTTNIIRGKACFVENKVWNQTSGPFAGSLKLARVPKRFIPGPIEPQDKPKGAPGGAPKAYHKDPFSRT